MMVNSSRDSSIITNIHWRFLIEKIEKKFQNWKEQLLSIGGRNTFINSILSAIPLYALSLYRVSCTILKDTDKLKCRFLWQGTDRSKKNMLWSIEQKFVYQNHMVV